VTRESCNLQLPVHHRERPARSIPADSARRDVAGL